MNRRNFIKNTIYTVAGASSFSSFFTFSNASAASGSTDINRILINIMLNGGADLRFLFVPSPDDTEYATKFWESRQNIYRNNAVNQALYNTYEDVWSDLYLPTTFNGMMFGIHKNAQWLKDQFDKNNVAIICNTVASTNRRHDHSQLIMHTGDLQANHHVYDREGWGGRLVKSIGPLANVVSVSHDVSPYCNSVNADNRLEQVVHVKDSRNFALPTTNNDPVSPYSIMGRSLKAYYEKRGIDIENKIANGRLPRNWPYRKFFQHERSIREFGDAFKSRLNNVMPNQPTSIRRLYAYKNLYKLKNTNFGRQCANLYDCLLAPDILQLRTAYMEYGGWDSHRNQKVSLEGKLKDLFGTNGGLHSISKSLDNSGANNDLVYTFTSDFGRQIKSNADKGTDHGEGTYIILIGAPVNGGVYGEMFPESEITPDDGGLTRFDQQGADIEGLTSYERVLSEVTDWVSQDSGRIVFPNTERNDLSIYPDGPILEQGVDLKTLFNDGGTISV